MSDSIDPYAPPEADLSNIDYLESTFSEQVFKETKKLYHRSHNIISITSILMLWTLGLIYIGSSVGPYVSQRIEVYIGLAVLYGGAFLGMYMRTSWGRILGIVVSVVNIASLTEVPLGALFGIYTLYTCLVTSQLFGKDRLTHKHLKAEYKRLKAERKKIKKQKKLEALNKKLEALNS